MADYIHLIVAALIAYSSVVLSHPDIENEYQTRTFRLIHNLRRVDIPVNVQDVRFLFYNSGLDSPIILTTDNARSLLNPSAPTTFIIHGWTHNGTSPWIRTMALLLNQYSAPINVVAVDYGPIASNTYIHAYRRSKSIGHIIAGRIWELQLPAETIHIIGHSLGAQVAAFAGQKIGSRTVGRITGLDPAGPLFEQLYHLIPKFRLSEGDAICVDVIHTTSFVRGYDLPTGTIDFFVNGAVVQPECINWNLHAAVSCSHQLAHTFYSLSIINGTRYQGVDPLSGKMAYMGHQHCSSSTGNFWVDAPATGEDPNLV